ncbi:MAG: hypothetical protein JXB13_06795 [Phycisphaerae bacterium]|nr:hypothetical protein [Phycisphaerae bacterium]
MPKKNTVPEPPLPPRLAATLALIPLSIGFIILSVFAIEFADLPEKVSVILVFLGVLLSYYVPAQWIWWRTVIWTPRRRFGVLATNLVFGLVLIVALATTFGHDSWYEPWRFLFWSLLVTVGGGVALIIINAICYSPHGKRPDRIVPCPSCGHNLSGAGACRCPACNSQFTLGELARSYVVAEALGLTDTGEVTAKPGDPNS